MNYLVLFLNVLLTSDCISHQTIVGFSVVIIVINKYRFIHRYRLYFIVRNAKERTLRYFTLRLDVYFYKSLIS